MTPMKILSMLSSKFSLGWEFQFSVSISGTPIVSRIPILFLIPKILVGFFCWNSNVWRVKKLEFRFAIFGILVICLRRNSLRLIVADLYWLQSMYNDLILMVHKLVAPLQHQTADQHHVISWHRQWESCHCPAILNRWCNQWHWCASGKNQGRSWARNCHHFLAPRSQCATTTWSWPSCREVEYDRHLLNLSRGMWIYSYWDGDDAKDGNTCSLWWFSIDESEIQDMAASKKMLIDTETPLANSNCPPPVNCNGREINMSARFVPHLPFDWVFSSALYWLCDWTPQTYVCNAQYCSPSL